MVFFSGYIPIIRLWSSIRRHFNVCVKVVFRIEAVLVLCSGKAGNTIWNFTGDWDWILILLIARIGNMTGTKIYALKELPIPIRLYMGPNNLCCVTPHFLLFFFFSVSHVTFYKNFTSSRHRPFILSIYIYIIIILYKTCMSIFVFYKISMSIVPFYKILTSFSTVFIKAHVGFYNF